MSLSVTTNSINSIPPLTTPDGELIKRGRIKSAADLVSTYWTLFNADWESSRQRAINQSMVDGAQPYSNGNERRLGLWGRTNVNWGLAAQALKDKERPFTDILETIDVFGTFPTDYGSQAERDVWEPILAQEITRIIRGWDDFHSLWQQNAHLFTMEGLSFAFFEDCYNWKWRIHGQQFLKFPRRTRANVNFLDVICCQVDMLPAELYRKVENEKVAKDMGWNRAAVLEAIKQTASQHGIPGNDPAEWERAWKDNDIMYSTTTTTVQTIHGFIKELDGSVSYYIARLDGQGDFLYKRLGSYYSMSSLLVAYADGVGTNGDFQSIRGCGQELFASSGAINRVLCKFLDMACHVATPHLAAENEDVTLENAFRPMGPYMGITNGLEFQEMKVAPFDQTLIPALDSLQNVFNNRGGRTSPGLRSSSRTQKTAEQVQAEAEQDGSLTTGQMNLFFVAWRNHLREIVRRLKREDYRSDEPGGQEVWELRARLVGRGVPLQALYQIDCKGIEVNTGIGKGSVSERRAVASALKTLVFPDADERGKQIINRMLATAYAGVRIGAQIVPDEPGLRPPVDRTIAGLENNDLADGKPVQVEPNQNHAVHVEVHLQRLQALNEGLTNLELDLEQAIPQMFPLWEHANQHLQFMNPMARETAAFKQALQQLGEVIINGQKHIDAEAQRAEEEMAGEEGYGGTPAGTYKQAVQADAELQKLQLDVAAKRMNLMHDDEKRTLENQALRQRLVENDALTVSKIRNMQAVSAAKIAAEKKRGEQALANAKSNKNKKKS